MILKISRVFLLISVVVTYGFVIDLTANPLEIGSDYQKIGPFTYRVTHTAGLLNVLSSISGNSLFQYTIELAPGLYGVPETIYLTPGVNLVGAGKNLTRISAALEGPVILASSNSSIKGLSVYNVGSAPFYYSEGIRVSTKAKVTIEDVAITLNGDGDLLSCIYASVSSEVTLKNLTLVVDPASTSTDQACGIKNFGNLLNVSDTEISVKGAQNNFGIYSRSPNIRVRNCRIDVTDPGRTHYGIQIRNFLPAGTALIDQSRIFSVGNGIDLFAELGDEEPSSAERCVDLVVRILNSAIQGDWRVINSINEEPPLWCLTEVWMAGTTLSGGPIYERMDSQTDFFCVYNKKEDIQHAEPSYPCPSN